MTLESKVKVKYNVHLKCIVKLTLIPLPFLWLVFIFSRLVAYGVKMATTVPENHYDIEVNRQGQIYF